jgi:DNA-binding beta-propeller fold protein YncE
MKNIRFSKTIKPAVSRLRISAAGVFLLGAAALAAVAVNPNPPKLPWATPVISVGTLPSTAEVDIATNTIYVPNPVDNTISVIDGRKCNANNSSRCSPIATMTNVGFAPLWPTFDRTSRTLYVTNAATESGDDGNTVAVLNVANCNAHNTSGCSQAPVALVTIAGATGNGIDGADMALDAPLHTLYVSDVNFGPLSMINTTTCNALQTSGCNQVLTTTATGLGISIDPSNHSVYVSNLATGSLSVFNGATCNADTQSDCGDISVAQLPADYFPYYPGIDPTTHSVYLPLFADTDVLGYTAVIDGSTCNGTDHSGCGQTPQLVLAGSLPLQVVVDPSTRTAYTISELSNTITAINTSTCNGTDHSGCPTTVPPALAVGVNPIAFAINPETHTIYVPSQDTNRVWVLDASKCNARHTQGCTKFEPTTTVGVGPFGIANNPNTRTVYEANETDNTVSVIDATACNKDNLAGCNQTWPTTNVGNVPQFIGINKITNTIYVSNFVDNTLSVIDGATCNGQITSGCMQPQPTTPVGALPYQVAVDETTNTIYVGNSGDNTVSVINGDVCNAGNLSGCNQSWPIVTVGASPQGLAVNPSNDTLYVANRGDNTVSVINTLHCNAHDSSGCGQTPATIAVGDGPRSVGIVFATNTVFVGNRNDLTVSVIDGSTCNGGDTTGCGQTPPAVLVGAFPDTGGNGVNINGRTIAIDQQKQLIFVPIVGDSDVAVLDGHACRAGHADACHVKIAKERAGGFPVTAAVDESTATVYVVNDDDGTVSLFPSSR